MMIWKKVLLAINFFIVGSYVGTAQAITVKKAEVVAGDLLRKQRFFFEPADISLLADNIESHFNQILVQYESDPARLLVAEEMLKRLGEKSDFVFKAPLKLSDETKLNLAKLYRALENNQVEFVEILKGLGFMDKGRNEEEDALYAKTGSRDIVERNRNFMKMLLPHDNEQPEVRYLFSAGRKLFYYCFGDETFPEFYKMILDQKSHSLVRFLYTITWWGLSGTGWRVWNKDTLKVLKKEADAGKRVVYIGGGSDWYRLVSNGIYNVTMIDPQLPTQPKYYADEWAWMVKGDDKAGGIGDEIALVVDGQNLVMRRTSYTEGEYFSAQVAGGAMLRIPTSKTVWTIYDASASAEYSGPLNFAPFKQIFGFFKRIWGYFLSFFSGAKGSLILDRRFVKQDDFAYDANKIFHMSFNEIFYISVKDWGVDPKLFDDRVGIYCKQLGDVVTKKQMCNIQDAFAAKFHFIRLGSCIN